MFGILLLFSCMFGVGFYFILADLLKVPTLATTKAVITVTGREKKQAWKVITDHHEVLISEEIFEQVSLTRTGSSTKRNSEKHPLTGILFCGGCRYSMKYNLYI